MSNIYGLKNQTIIKITLSAGHDRNGNPRKAIIAYDLDGQVIKAFTTAYGNEGDFDNYFNPNKTKSNKIVDLGQFDTTPSQIKEFF